MTTTTTVSQAIEAPLTAEDLHIAALELIARAEDIPIACEDTLANEVAVRRVRSIRRIAATLLEAQLHEDHDPERRHRAVAALSDLRHVMRMAA